MSRRWVITGGFAGHRPRHQHRPRCRAGDRVAVLARTVDPALAATLGNNALCLAADVADPASLKAALDAVAAQWGGIDVLVNNAGLHRGGRVDKLKVADWDAVLATNLSGPLHTVRAALPHMGAGGAIVNIGAVVGFRGFPRRQPLWRQQGRPRGPDAGAGRRARAARRARQPGHPGFRAHLDDRRRQ